MIPASQPAGASTGSARPDWQRLLASAIQDGDELLRELGLAGDAGLVARLSAAAARDFRLRVPRGFVRRMRRGDPDDPLLRQVLPLRDEVEPRPGWVLDPLAETTRPGPPGLLHKYHGRALLVATGACAVHCRYCFRRHFPYAERSLGRHVDAALDWLRGETSIREVILSGGDPLVLPDEQLSRLAETLAGIPHLERLRVHSRLPIVLPERVDDRLLAWLAGTRLRPVLVVHANHANELDETVASAFELVRRHGVPLLNQAVLLAGVNDSAEAQIALSERLFELGALPYYLHLMDRVAGAAHFEVNEERGREILAEVAARLPGYLVPRLVREVPSAAGKVSIPFDLPAR